MSFWPVPDAMKGSIYEIAPRMFTNRGIRFIILDIDNTVAPYTVPDASERMKAWVRGLREAGLELFVLSNNRGERPERFAAAFGLPYRKKAWKPFTRAAKEVMAVRNTSTALPWRANCSATARETSGTSMHSTMGSAAV